MSHEFGPVNIEGLGILKNPIVVGAGPIKTVEDVKVASKSEAAGIIVGSITKLQREGNVGKTYYKNLDGSFSLNSKGLPNPGLEYYKTHLKEMVQIAHDKGQLLMVSIAGFSPKENGELVYEVALLGPDGIQANLGCPNVWGKDGAQKPIPSYDKDLTFEITHEIENAVGNNIFVYAKTSWLSPNQLVEIASVLGNSKTIKGISAINTIANSISFDENDKPIIDPGNGLAGLSGKALLPMSMGQIAQYRKELGNKFILFGVGGITTNDDVHHYQLAGANGVEITTAYVDNGGQIISQILHPEKE
jgi:dihydroorotate dehydrogenase